MKDTRSPLWSSIGILIGVVIGILAITTGKLRQTLLIITMTVWTVWFVGNRLITLRRQAMQRKEREASMAESARCNDLLRKLLAHVNIRVSAALRSVYPNASWEWAMDNPLRYVAEGGIGRIRVYNVPDYEYADVTLGSDAALSCALVRLSSVDGSTPQNDQPAPNPAEWFDKQARKSLIELMNDLNTRGHSKLFLKEDGTVCIQPVPGGEQIPQRKLNGFPAREAWPKLADVLTDAGLDATVLDDRIQIAW